MFICGDVGMGIMAMLCYTTSNRRPVTDSVTQHGYSLVIALYHYCIDVYCILDYLFPRKLNYVYGFNLFIASRNGLITYRVFSLKSTTVVSVIARRHD